MEKESDMQQVQQSEEEPESPPEQAPVAEPQIDPYRLRILMERMRSEQSLLRGVMGGGHWARLWVLRSGLPLP